jgi:rubrerythrin
MAGETIHIDGGYPVDISEGIVDLLRFAVHNEYEEHDDVYKNFAKIAKEEGFESIAGSFQMIANIEKCHGDRFAKFAQLLEENKLFISDVETAWMCLNCGNIYYGTQPPKECPVCHEDRGYYIRLSLAPYTCTSMFEN